MAGPRKDIMPEFLGRLQYPLDREEYHGVLRFTPEPTVSLKETPQIELYLPSSIAISDGVSYDNFDAGAGGNAALRLVQNVADKGFFQGMKQSVADGSYSASNADEKKAIAAFGVSSLISKFGDKVGGLSQLGTRTAPNPNTKALFKQVSLRQFSFTFKLIPASEEEARTIGQIITAFRTQMYPETINLGPADTGYPVGYEFPGRYEIEAFYNGQEMRDYRIRSVPSYLTNVSTNYNPSSQTIMKSKDGSPYFSEIDITLSFIEGKTLDRKSVEEARGGRY